MAYSNTGSSTSKTKGQSKAGLSQFKMEVASELGVPLKNGYNGDLTSAQNGSVGGEMVRKMIKSQEDQISGGSSN